MGVLELSNRRPIITVFGSALPHPGSSLYEQARVLGHRIASEGFRLCNGGYGGTMEAAARGAREACVPGQVAGTIGVTCEFFGERSPNRWVDEIHQTSTLLERLQELIALAEAFVVLPGGTGTLLEFATVLELTAQGIVAPRPLLLLGPYWEPVLRVAREQTMSTEPDRLRATVVSDIEQCVAFLVDSLGGLPHER